MPHRTRLLIALSCLILFVSARCSIVVAQEDAVVTSESEDVVQETQNAEKEASDKNRREQERRRGPERGERQQPTPPPGKQGPGEKKPEDAKQPETIKRPNKPEVPFDPRQYEAIKPDLNGKYKLAFVGTPWPPLIQWLGEISGKSVDWHELPGDYLNLRTQRAYSVGEIQDIINRHLLSRGFTILVDGELLTVEKTADINPSLVPRVPADALSGHMPHEFVRVLFDLDWLLAEEMAKELKPLLSKNGKLNAFPGTNRIEVMDSVRNLQQVAEIIDQEQSTAARNKLVREFKLKNVQAGAVRKKLEELLGVKGSSAPQMTPQQIQQQQEMMRRMRERGQQPPPQQQQQSGSKEKVSFVVNEQRNSLIATAPPNKMAIIAEAIAILDVPTGHGDSLDSYLGRMKAYRLVSLNPTEVVEILTETGGLDPQTKLKVDEKNKSIIANAPPWDHLTIQKLIEKLDGSAREFRVLRLRRRRADRVATTIQGLMVGEPKEDDSRSRRYRWWDWDGRDEEEQDDDSFRVAADIEHNWLLLWCNDQEYQQVLRLLQELGEIPEQGTTSSTYRVLDELPSGETKEFVERIRQAFEQMAPNPIIIDPAVEKKLKEEEERKAREAIEAEKEQQREEAEQIENSLPKTRDVRTNSTTTRFIQTTDRPNAAARSDANEATPAPIRISVDASGRLVVQSDDPRALDLFEELAQQMVPQPKGFHVFKLKHAMATWVVLKLEAFFEDEEDNQNNDVPWWWYDDFPQQKDDNKVGLGDPPKIKFVSEMDSNTIVVRNATESQLRTIEELLKIYDVPEPIDPKRARYTTIYNVKYSRASLIAETIKSAFPDLLSRNDQVVQRGRQSDRRRRRDEDDEDEERPSSGGGLLLGKLSIGADDATNTLIVSTEGEQLQKLMIPIIEKLDKAAQTADTVKVYALPAGSSAQIAESISSILGAGNTQQRRDNEPGENNGRRGDRDNDRDERNRRRGRERGGESFRNR